MPSRNVVNVSAVDDFVEAAGSQTDHLALRRWVSRTVRRWILKHHDGYFPVVRSPSGGFALADPDAGNGTATRPLPSEPPDWCAGALDAGQKVVFLKLDGDLQKRVRRTISYLDQTADPAAGPALNRVSFPQAEHAARAWHSKQADARRASGFSTSVVPVMRLDPDAMVVRLASADALEDEGRRMRHCVATYADDVADNMCQIFSLRAMDGKPQATIEVDGRGRVQQVKGYANGPVPAQYRPALRRFLRARGYTVANDINNCSSTVAVLGVRADDLGRVAQRPDGQRLLRDHRYVGPDQLAHADAGLVTRIIAGRAPDLSNAAARAVFEALAPSHRAPLRLRPAGGFRVYDMVVPVFRVEAPLPFLNLVRRGSFRGRAFEGEATAVFGEVEARLLALVSRPGDTLFSLGPAYGKAIRHPGLWSSARDFLADCPLDLGDARAERHRALRRRLNRAKQRAVGMRARPSPGLVAVRRLLSGRGGEFVI